MSDVTSPSPTERISFDGYSLYLKRDDLLHPHFSGNKARKFHYFLNTKYPNIRRLISYGSAQSNAMYSLSILAKMRGWEFDYYVDHIASYLAENPHGNYAGALSNGMHLHVDEALPLVSDRCLSIEEGGRQEEASYGLSILAQEIRSWQEEQGIEELNIFLPSGTGTTALYLKKHLSLSGATQSEVYTCACVGDSVYLEEQFSSLEKDKDLHPQILSLDKKHHFGKLYKDNYKIWLKLQEQTGVVFDLLYDPLGWRTLLAHPEVFSKPMLYIHQGGVLGNESMLPRYKRKYPHIEEQ